MPLLNWLRRKEPNRDSVLVDEHVSPTTVHNPKTSSRKEARMERRDLLFTVIGGVMVKMGMLPSSYKFKVLTLNAEGFQHLIMVDMARDRMRDTTCLEEIEFHIKQEAKQKHDLVVNAVYFRVNPHLSALSTAVTNHANATNATNRNTKSEITTASTPAFSTPVPPPSPPPAPPPPTPPPAAEVQSEKAKSALNALFASSENSATHSRSRSEESSFADTQIEDDHHAASPSLEPTQPSAGT